MPSAFAYLIKQELTVKNETGIDLKVDINDATHLLNKSEEIKIPLDNNSAYTGFTGEKIIKNFSIYSPLSSSQYPYVRGRVIFYTRFDIKKYSFLDSVVFSPPLQVDQSYDCRGYFDVSNPFQNKLVIKGQPSEASTLPPPLPENDKIICKKHIKSSKIEDYNIPDQFDREDPGIKYTVNCTDGSNETFTGRFDGSCGSRTHFNDCRDIKKNWYYKWGRVATDIIENDPDKQKSDLDDKIGSKFCVGWEKD